MYFIASSLSGMFAYQTNGRPGNGHRAAGAYAFATLSAILAIPCEHSLDPQRFCVWWGHSALPTLLGVPAVLGFGCYASFTTRSPRPVVLAGALIVLVCLGLEEAAVQEL